IGILALTCRPTPPTTSPFRRLVMTRRIFRSLARITLTISALAICGIALAQREYESGKIWPEPRVVEPGTNGSPPADAIVLIDGKDMSAWNNADDWQIKDGAVTVNPRGKPYAESKQAFGDCQLHVEWAEPEVVRGTGQGRGNSGVYLMGRYEVQILDSYNNKT